MRRVSFCEFFLEFETNEDHIVCDVLWWKDFKDFRSLLSRHELITEESYVHYKNVPATNRVCCCSLSYLDSLNKCILWKAPSGKSGSNFFKSYGYFLPESTLCLYPSCR